MSAKANPIALRWCGAATLLGAVVGLVGCHSESTKQCQQRFQTAQIVVQNQSGSPDGLDASIAVVDLALTACRTADRQKEVEQLEAVRNVLGTHMQALRERGSREKHAKLSSAEMSGLAKSGDPNCPRGMAYSLEGGDQQVKCMGPPPMRMSWRMVREFYENQGFHVTSLDAPPTLRAERGSELYLFKFSKADDPQPVRCLTAYPEPGITWQEAVGRATGTPLQKLKLGGSVPMKEGNVMLRVEQGQDKLVIYLGNCEGA